MRLTEKKESYIEELKTNGHIYFVDDILPNNCKLTGRSINKLGQLEDIEEELGIDLTTLFKALKNGAWFNCNNDDVNFIDLRKLCEMKALNPLAFYKERFIKLIANDIGWFLLLYDIYPFNTKDYGKTWALTKEELL